MSSTEDDRFRALKAKVERGNATDQEKIDFAVLSGRRAETSSRHLLHMLSNDQSEDVRYYALRSLVLDSIDRTSNADTRCWELFENDPAARVRALAAACLGSLHFASKDRTIFARLKKRIGTTDDKQEAEAALEALFGVAGRPPTEWPTQRRILGGDFSGDPKDKDALGAEADDLEARFMV